MPGTNFLIGGPTFEEYELEELQNGYVIMEMAKLHDRK